MKILMVSQCFWPENFRINEICLDLQSRGHDVEVLTGLPNIPDGKFYQGYSFFHKGPQTYHGIKLHRVRIFPRGKNNFALLSLNCASFAIHSLFHIPKLMRRNFDCILIYQLSPVSQALPGILLAKLRKIRCFTYVLDIWPESMFFLLNMPEEGKSLFRTISYKVSSFLYRGSDYFLTSSKGMRNKLTRFGIEDERISYLPNCSDDFPETSVNQELLAKLQLDGKFIIAFAGNIGRAQGIDQIIEAAKQTNDLPNLHWLIMGDGTEFNNIKALVDQYMLQERVTLTGWINAAELPQYLVISSALVVMLKKHEIFSLTVPSKMQTYLSAGKPILAWMDGEGAQVIEDSGAGYTSQALDIDSFCNNVRKLYALDEASRNRMGENGKRYFEENYSREKVMNQFCAYLTDKANRKPI